MAKRNRYRKFEQMMTLALLANAVLFVFYLICAVANILWLQIILAILTVLLPLGGLVFLVLSQELLRSRSLWLSCGFFAILMCTLASLILAFP